jgi:hypothetical protein
MTNIVAYHPGWFEKDKLKNVPDYTTIYVDNINIQESGVISILKRKIIWFIQVEPEAFLPLENYLIHNWKKYDKILTFNQNVLNQCPNAAFYVYGTTWITERNPNTSLKQFKMSSITGWKTVTDGHRFRKYVYARQLETPIPSLFYRDSYTQPLHDNPELGKSKFPLFETFQFSLVIENSRQLNYFTEKLSDCLITKTIPIYYGAPNIAAFFDTTGWIILEDENVDTLFEKLKQLTPSYYSEYTSTIEKNYETVQKYLDVYENMNRATQDL